MEEETTIDSFVTVRSKGEIDDSLFQYYIRNIVLPLYPNISNKCLIVDGKIIKGPVIFKTDSGPGRIKEDITHVNFLEEMNNIGLKIMPMLNWINFLDRAKEIVDHEQWITFQRNYRTRSR